MTIQKMRYLIEIVNTGSMSEAAKKLFITQPSLSSSVKELEEQLGFHIFVRTNKGVVLSQEGVEFLGYARQIVEQADLMEQRYLNAKPSRQLLCVSTQHYAFVVQAFVAFVKEFGTEEYEFSFRDTRSYEILEDVRTLRSEIGVIYLNEFNKKVLGALLKKYGLEFHSLFHAEPHIFVCTANPLAKKKRVTLAELEDYPYLSYEQGENNSFYFSEEILSTIFRRKTIRVSDRATIFNLMIGLNGYTISTGVMNADLNGSYIVAVPLAVEEHMTVGWIAHKSIALSKTAEQFVKKLEEAAQNSIAIG